MKKLRVTFILSCLLMSTVFAGGFYVNPELGFVNSPTDRTITTTLGSMSAIADASALSGVSYGISTGYQFKRKLLHIIPEFTYNGYGISYLATNGTVFKKMNAVTTKVKLGLGMWKKRALYVSGGFSTLSFNYDGDSGSSGIFSSKAVTESQFVWAVGYRRVYLSTLLVNWEYEVRPQFTIEQTGDLLGTAVSVRDKVTMNTFKLGIGVQL
ncbi:hypothetical protein DID80_05210 [Candidatus Marinamargulisbacteria bacterium SCGC AAA071-K20]|nr:hypothetical protein DID80_05210 [Candidatus Marinamargulisbacteria bacterium SCGC AAA071-K20]